MVIPCHYNTFPLIAADPHAFAADVVEQLPGVIPAVLDPMGTVVVPAFNP